MARVVTMFFNGMSHIFTFPKILWFDRETVTKCGSYKLYGDYGSDADRLAEDWNVIGRDMVSAMQDYGRGCKRGT